MELTYKTKVKRLGSSLAVIIPAEHLKYEQEKVNVGDIVIVTIKK